MIGAGPVDDLMAVLAAEAGECRRLLPLLEDQERALLRADARTALDLFKQQEPVALRLAQLEKGRRMLVGRLAAALGVDGEGLTLAKLLARVPDPPAGLTSLRAELRDLLDRLGALTRRNGFLVERSLWYVQRLLNHLVSSLALGAPPTYAATGRAAHAVPALTFVDRRA